MSAAVGGDKPEDWQVMVAENGLQYYYNKRTKKALWQKPECLKNESEKAPQSSEWTEHVTADGRTFYHNAILKKSVWVKPPELMTEAEKNSADAARGPINLDISITTNIEENAEEDAEEEAKRKEVTLEEAKRIFLALLKEKNIDPNMKWNQIHELLKKEERYKILQKVSEKKKVLAAYVGQIKKNERFKARTKLEQSRQDYRQMLSEFKNLTSESKYNQVVQYFFMDPRYKAIEMKDRENLFQDYLDELFEKEKEDYKKQRKDMIARMREHFQDLPIITTNTKWQEACELLKYNAVWQELHDLDKVEAFSDFILAKEKEDEAEKKKKKGLQERANREAFRALLREKVDNDDLTFKTKWRNFLKRNKDSPKVLNMFRQAGSTAREIFHDFRATLVDKNKQVKDDFKKLLHKQISDFSVNMELARFKKILLRQPEFQDFDKKETNSFDYYAEYLFTKYKKRVNKAKKKFTRVVVKEVPDLSKDSLFEDVLAKVNLKEAYAAYFSCLSGEDKRDIFRGILDKLRAGEDLSQLLPPEKKKKKKLKSQIKDEKEEARPRDKDEKPEERPAKPARPEEPEKKPEQLAKREPDRGEKQRSKSRSHSSSSSDSSKSKAKHRYHRDSNPRKHPDRRSHEHGKEQAVEAGEIAEIPKHLKKLLPRRKPKRRESSSSYSRSSRSSSSYKPRSRSSKKSRDGPEQPNS